ncbi:putative ribonuclease H-like domain-containing protein [Tanacetum coccineum]|uniref:Ribonuclease H-like domain-containing protein n=1 Tax=Tanacetum coccineum TaxID=301880 RepID=A0ABQ4Z2B7_9ASTR
MTHPSPKRNMVPKAVLMMSGLVSLTTTKPVNTAQPRTTVNNARSMTNIFNKAHSTVRRPINNKTTTKNSNFNKKVNTVSGKNVNIARPKAVVNTAKPKALLNAIKGNQINAIKASACWVWKPKTKGNPQMDLQDQGVIDSRCSRYMIGNMSYLTDFEEIDGGYVAFGGNPKGGKITRKATKDETSGILKSFITGVENLIDQRVKKKTSFAPVARIEGCTQKERIADDKVFAPIARIEAIRLFLSYASFKDFVVYQMDVKSAFLYGKIEKEVYICQPPGFEDPNFPDRVYKVEKTLYGIHQGPRACTPMETQKPLLKDEDGEEVDVHLYRSMIGSLMYLTSLRPDIMFAVSYTDSDYAGGSLNRKSTTGGCQFLRCRLISWQCKKQTVVANSTTEAEYVAASSCCGQVLWIKNQLLDYRDSNEKKLIQMIKIHTDKNVADLLTKAFDLQTLVDRKKIIITEATVRRDIQLEDADGVDCLPNAIIFDQLTLMGTMASAVICLATNQKFNFSKYSFESMVKNLDSAVKFLMYPRFVQVFLNNQLEGMATHNIIYIAPSHTKKVFANMKRQGKDFSGRVTPLFSTMMVQAQ